MQLKHKIAVLTVLPLLMAIAVMAVLVTYQARRLGEQQAALIEANALAGKQAELRHYVALARTAIGHLYDSGRVDAATLAQAKQILGNLGYGNDGYFFVYDRNGNSLVHPRLPRLVGRNQWNLTDPHGLHVIRALLGAAQSGDGFQRYAWEKPSTHQVTDKLGYVVMLDRWGWMIGTGVYLDDIERQTRQVRIEVAANTRATLWGLAAVALAVLLLVFAGGLVLNVSEHRLADAKLKTLAQRIVSLQEEERARVSRELHDGISQLLVSTKYQFELAQDQLEQNARSADGALRKGLAGLGDAIGEVRRISHDLRPSILDTLGLAAALQQLGNEFEQRTGTEVSLHLELDPAAMPDRDAVALFRIAQEAFTNVERHARARHVTVDLSHDDETVRLMIIDDGRGFDVQAAGRAQGIGLRNIAERVEHLGGTLALESEPGRTALTIELPLRP